MINPELRNFNYKISAVSNKSYGVMINSRILKESTI